MMFHMEHGKACLLYGQASRQRDRQVQSTYRLISRAYWLRCKNVKRIGGPLLGALLLTAWLHGIVTAFAENKDARYYTLRATQEQAYPIRDMDLTANVE